MAKYIKKPVEIDAFQFTGDNHEQVFAWVDEFEPQDDGPAMEEGENETLLISTLEGEMTASKGDYIIRGVQGEYYPCKPAIFIKTYTLVEPILDKNNLSIPGRTAFEDARDDFFGR